MVAVWPLNTPLSIGPHHSLDGISSRSGVLGPQILCRPCGPWMDDARRIVTPLSSGPASSLRAWHFKVEVVF